MNGTLVLPFVDVITAATVGLLVG